MSGVAFAFGATVAFVLLALLVISVLAPRYRIWPTPGDGSPQSFVFWPLFRTLNVLCFAVAILDRTPLIVFPIWAQVIFYVLLALALSFFVYAFRTLGRDTSYCARDGLVTGGIYRWSRNPQNTMLVVVYGCLALAADSASAWLLCAAMMAVYALMVIAEEPWLIATYGRSYRLYCRRVPRFFNWRRAWALLLAARGKKGLARGRRRGREMSTVFDMAKLLPLAGPLLAVM